MFIGLVGRRKWLIGDVGIEPGLSIICDSDSMAS